MKKLKGLILSASLLLAVLFLSGCELIVFDSAGPQAQIITDLINWSLVWIGLILVVVLAIFIVFVWKYRARPDNEDYMPPQEEGNKVIEVIWTLIPIVIIVILLVPTVKSLYALEEVPAEYADQEPLVIHVTSADWKWIFSYPEENIETINYVTIPTNRPVIFKLTSAGTMQSFWIPQLAGQKYSMANMETELPIVAEREGEYFGRNTSFNGEGYQEMEFSVEAVSQEDFDAWVEEVHAYAPELTEEEYYEKLQPSHLGRETYVGTHLQWINHAEHGGNANERILNPEAYRGHGYPGKIFHDPSEIPANEDENGGGHSGH